MALDDLVKPAKKDDLATNSIEIQDMSGIFINVQSSPISNDANIIGDHSVESAHTLADAGGKDFISGLIEAAKEAKLNKD